MPTTRSGEVVKRKRKLEAPAACPASAKTEFADPGANEWSEHTSYASATPEVQTRSLLLDSASKACPTSLSITRAGFKRQHGVSNLGAPQQDPLQQGDTGATPSTAACAGLAGLETPLAQQSSLQPPLCNGEPSTCLYGNSLGHRSAADTPALNAIEPAIQMSTDSIKRGLTYSSLAATDTPSPPSALVSEPIASRTPFTTSPNHTVSTEDPSSPDAIEPCSMQTSDENRLWQERAAPAACPPVVSPEALAARLFDSSDPQAATAALLRLLMQSLPDHTKQSLPHAALHLQQAGVLTQVGANTSAPAPGAPCFSSRPSPSPGSSSQHTTQWPACLLISLRELAWPLAWGPCPPCEKGTAAGRCGWHAWHKTGSPTGLGLRECRQGRSLVGSSRSGSSRGRGSCSRCKGSSSRAIFEPHGQGSVHARHPPN
ncbi:hypothetical protein V8C86DRAFT_1682448 [Haematococcus lacustris]